MFTEKPYIKKSNANQKPESRLLHNIHIHINVCVYVCVYNICIYAFICLYTTTFISLAFILNGNK